MRCLTCLLYVSALLAGCASYERIPKVSLKENTAGILVSDIREHGPESLFGRIDEPDVPPGVILSLTQRQTLSNTIPRFIPAYGRLKIVSIQNPKKYNLELSLERWRHILTSKQPEKFKNELYENQLGEIPWTNAGRCFHAKLQYHSFPWGNAILFLTTYVQGITRGPVSNDMLVLVVQGITSDGHYAVNGHFDISHARLPDSLSKKGKVYFSIYDENAQAEAWLNQQPDDLFRPTIQDYIVFLTNLQIESP